MRAPDLRRSEFSLGWKTLCAAVIGVACGASPVPYNVIGFTVAPLTAEFGWSRTQILGPITLFGITAALLAPAFGWMADHYGVRRVALWSLLGFAVTFAMIALTPPSLPVYYGLWFLVGIVGIGSTPVTWSRAVNLWFFRQRGLALGVLLLGTSLTALVVPHLAVWTIETLGWRGLFPVTTPLAAFVALPLGLLWFHEPRPDQQPEEIRSATGQLTGVRLGTAVRDFRFWLIWMSVALIAVSFGGAFINLVPILGDRGLDASAAANAVMMFGIGVLFGRIITGLLLDRFWAGFVAFPLLCLPALASVFLLQPQVALLTAMLAGFLLGFAAGAESDLIAYLTGRYFGMRHYGKIYGMLYMPFAIFSAVSPSLYAWVRDSFGSYNPALTASIAMYLLGGGLLLLTGSYPRTFTDCAKAGSGN